MNGHELADNIGVTYRQIDHWTTRGYIKARAASPGSGINRDYDAAQVAIAHTVGALVRFGFTLIAAAETARLMNDTGVLRSGNYLLVKVAS